jgi:hypothetical protein
MHPNTVRRGCVSWSDPEGNATMGADEIERWIDQAIEADPQPEIGKYDDGAAGPPLSSEDLARGRAELD